MRRELFGAVLSIFLASGVFGQTIENGWKGIEPLKTTKSEVEKILGKPEIDNDGFHKYRLDGAYIRINYSSIPCREDFFGRGKYKVPADTVLDYSVHWSDGINIVEISFDRKSFHRETDGHVAGLVHYISSEGDVLITADIHDKTEIVGRILFNIGASKAKVFPCPLS